MALFPADVFPSVEDTADTLAARLGGCDFLDDIHFKKGGHGKRGATKAINKSKYPQPRRKTWSVVVDSSQDQPPHSQDQAALYAYNMSASAEERAPEPHARKWQRMVDAVRVMHSRTCM